MPADPICPCTPPQIRQRTMRLRTRVLERTVRELREGKRKERAPRGTRRGRAAAAAKTRGLEREPEVCEECVSARVCVCVCVVCPSVRVCAFVLCGGPTEAPRRWSSRGSRGLGPQCSPLCCACVGLVTFDCPFCRIWRVAWLGTDVSLPSARREERMRCQWGRDGGKAGSME